MKLSEKQLLVLTIIAPSVVAVVLAGLGYFVFQKKLAKITADIQSVKTQEDAAKKKLDQMAELETKIRKLKQEKEDKKDLLPTLKEVSYEDFLNYINKISGEAPIALQGATYAGAATPGGPPSAVQSSVFKPLAYTIKAEGSFYDCLRFVYLLETSKRFIKVNRFSLRPMNLQAAEKSGETIRHSLDIKFTAYYFDDKK
ncbi:MAG: hypothetical protein HY762_01360 [Planctomycetes bacterium]|nr:hypothetical protein [Planctomycetota bacterium]